MNDINALISLLEARMRKIHTKKQKSRLLRLALALNDLKIGVVTPFADYLIKAMQPCKITKLTMSMKNAPTIGTTIN
ncbi:hypothetical protein HJ067_24950, partial [Vibrio parahaemolyticus]|nr:hypothetical protein [Vibrio parahaemolyticus]